MPRKRYHKNKLTALIFQKSDFSDIPVNSIPSFGTINSFNSLQISSFFEDELKVCHNTVPNYPYKPARLVHYNYNMAKRWYVNFWAWDVSKEKLVRSRLFEPLNRIKSKSERRVTGEQMVRIINGQLRAGKVLGKDKVKATTLKIHNLSLLQAIEAVAEQKKLNGYRKNYYRTFNRLHTTLAGWLQYKKHPDFPLKSFDQNDADEFKNYLKEQKQLANKSINNMFGALGTAFKYIEKKGGIVWRHYPLNNIDRLPVVVKKHAAYSDEQIKAILQTIDNRIERVQVNRRSGYAQLKLFIRFIYYTLARPNEIMNLKVAHLQLQEGRIYIPGEISKNKIDDYVPLPAALIQQVEESDILKFDPADFIFSRNGRPGKEKLHENFFWDKHHRILKLTGLLELNPNFSLYSYKHSGAISLYKATRDIKIVQQQCRHRSSAETDLYLRDLGMNVAYNEVKTWRGAM